MLLLDLIFAALFFMYAGDDLGKFFRKEKDWRTGALGFILFLGGMFFSLSLVGLAAKIAISTP